MRPAPNIPISLDPDPVIDAYKPGIDVSLLDENLKLSVDERIRKLVTFMRAIDELRNTASDGRAADGRQVRETASRAR